MMTRRKLLGGGALLAALALASAGVLWYTVLRDNAPPKVNLSDAIASLPGSATTPAAASPTGSATTASVAPSAATASVTATTTAAASPAPSAAPVNPLAGVWTLAPAGDSFVGYRVKEELARIGSTTAVGRTKKLTGTLTFDGAAITSVQVSADLTGLQSDQPQRDGALRTQALETARYPTATFTLTQPIQLASIPAEGAPLRTTANGDLTLHGVTQPVQIDLEGQRTNGFLAVAGSLDINFADFGIAPPRSFNVLSVENHGVMELQLIFQQGSSG